MLPSAGPRGIFATCNLVIAEARRQASFRDAAREPVRLSPVPSVHAPRSHAPAAQLLPLAWSAAAGAAGALRRRARGADDLEDARELLAYWERRARRLPRWALMRRREARTMARVWRERVADAERLRYGRGLLGVASLYATEGRMPTVVAHRGRQAVRVAAWTAVTMVVCMLLVVAAAVAVVAEAVLSIL